MCRLDANDVISSRQKFECLSWLENQENDVTLVLLLKANA
jgi:hypothetical protein